MNGGFYKDTTETATSEYWYSPHALHTVVRASYLGLLNKTEQAQFLSKFYDFHDAEGFGKKDFFFFRRLTLFAKAGTRHTLMTLAG